ncbi:MAG: IS4 family transposase, partial [bacterium]|nr:IS4 family transposase [bacterium]
MTTKISKPLTLSGRYFSKKELAYIQQIVQSFPNLSLTELAQTFCEHLNWVTARGHNKINACLTALEKLEHLGMVSLPPKRPQKKRQSKAIIWSSQSDPATPVDCTLDALGTIRLEVITEKAEGALWNEMVDRHHYLRYRHPLGAALKYFVVAEPPERQLLGCLLFSASVWHLADRDQWIGWQRKDREQRLNLVINNNRFLIFPWVNVPNLASHVLSLATRQIRDDWAQVHAYRPVLIETFVDTTRYHGTCYQAANWECIGNTSGKDWKGDAEDHKGTVKSILVYPLQSNFRAILKNQPPSSKEAIIDESFLSLWGKVVTIISEVAQTFDETWQKRKRVIDSLLLVFLIFRLVFSKNSQSYGTTISEFWHHCHRMKFPLPQKQPISASSFTEARKKLDESIFKVLNQRIIQVCDEKTPARWFGHRLFGVDGSKLNLPRELIEHGYRTPSDNAHYPQGLLSCCYQLKSKTPYDFDLVSHGNERQCALNHLKTLKIGDVVVYDRGYFSYAMLYYHVQAGVHPIFRLQKNTWKEVDAFRNSDQTDQIITLLPSKDTQRDIKKQFPDLDFVPLKIRLIKYVIAGKTYCIGTTLMDSQYTIAALKDVYHARWGIEELYKVSKQLVEVDDFHGRGERTVKQELFAHFVLITMSRLCSNESEHLLASLLNLNPEEASETEQKIQVNFKNTLTTVSRHLEDILFAPACYIKTVMTDMVRSISRY